MQMSALLTIAIVMVCGWVERWFCYCDIISYIFTQTTVGYVLFYSSFDQNLEHDNCEN